MSNLKSMKTMKKLLYSVLAFIGIAAVSCNKEVEAPVAPEVAGTHTVVLKAAFAPETRTSYADNKTFSWVEGDLVYVRCLSSDKKTAKWFAFKALSSGATTDLEGEVEDGYRPHDVAVYVPGEDYVSTSARQGYDGTEVRVTLPISYHQDGYGLGVDDTSGDNTPYWNSVSIPSADPMSRLALVSVTKDDVLYFQTAMGALKVNVTDVSPEATHVRITSADGVLGNYLVVEDGEIRMSNAWYDDKGQRYATSFNEYYFEPVSDGNLSFYIPMPVGTLAAGSIFSIMDANDNILFSQVVKNDIEIVRNQVLELKPFSAKMAWESLGTGKFIDYYLWEDLGGGEDDYVDVEILKCTNKEGYYRIVNPYGAAAEAFHYTAPHNVLGPQDIEFAIIPVGSYLSSTPVTVADQIFYETVYTGVDAPDSYLDGDNTEDDLEYLFDHPAVYLKFSAEKDWGRNLVAKYAADGTPANVIIAPIYSWGGGYWSGNEAIHEYSIIQVLFPGVTAPVDLDSAVAYTEVVDDTPEQAVASVSVLLGGDVVSAKVVIAADLDAAKAAIAAGQNVTEVTADGDYEVLFPANAPTGEYQVFAYTQAKEGFTAAANQYIYSAPFKYFNASDPDRFTLEDVIGVYDSEKMYLAYYNRSWQWNGGDAVVTITIEESDDEFQGNVMITDIVCPAKTWGFHLLANDQYGPVYAEFNTKTGELLIPVSALYWVEGQKSAAWTGDLPDESTMMYLVKPGQLTVPTMNWVASLDDTGEIAGYTRIIGGFSDYTYTYTRREASSSAPAKAAPAVVRSNSVETGSAATKTVSGKVKSLSAKAAQKKPFGVNR